MTKRNHRPLATISAEIHRIERTGIVALGKLLLEAKDQLEHGKWLSFLRDIDWNPRTAELHMAVADLAAKIRIRFAFEGRPDCALSTDMDRRSIS